MLQDIRENLNQLIRTHDSSSSKSSESMQIKSSDGSQTPLAAGEQRTTTTTTSKSHQYRQKALAEIRNSLLPFEHGFSGAASVASTISSTTTSGISSASGLSNASGSSSPCQIIEHNGLDKDSAVSLQISHGYAYDEDGNGLRGIKVGRSNGENADHLYKLQLESQQNGLPRQTSGLSGIASKIRRKPSFENGGRETNLNLHRRSPALESSTNSTRSDSPSITLSSITSRSTLDSSTSSRTGAQLTSLGQDSVSHLQISRQYSPNFNLEPPPPPPPRPQVPPPTPPRGTTPPPPPPQTSEMRLPQSFLQQSQQVQQLLKRLSPAPQTTRQVQGINYNSALSQNSNPQRGTSPVSIGRSPMVVQNSLQAQLNHQIQSAIYNGGLPQKESLKYSISSSQPMTSGLAMKLAAPPPSYTSISTSRQSPTQGTGEFVTVSSQLQKRTSPTIYPQQMSLSTAAANSVALPTGNTAVSTPAGSSMKPLQAWSARQYPPIMLSVKSTQVQKPVLQTAVAPTSPQTATTPHPPPSYTLAVQQKVEVPPPTPSNNFTPASVPVAPTNQLMNSSSQYSAVGHIMVPSIPTTDPPSYASTMQALAAQRSVASIAPSHANYNHLQYTATALSASTSSTPSSAGVAKPMDELASCLETQLQMSSPGPDVNSHSAVGDCKNLPAKQVTPSSILKQNAVDYNQTSQHKYSSMVGDGAGKQQTISRPVSPSHLQNDHTPGSFQQHFSANTQMEPIQESSCNNYASSTSSTRSTPPPSYKMTLQSPIPERKVQSKEKEEERKETKVRIYSPQAFKFFMEQHVENVLKSHQQRLHRSLQLESEMAKVGLSEEAQTQMRRMLRQKESNYIRLKRAKMDKAMFVKIKAIGVGAFGEVALVRKVDTNHLYAMKTLRKAYVLKRNQVAHVKAERDILAEADNEWVVKLYYSFQDKDNLYFVMDYIPGGDLMSLLIKFGIFEENLARFYIAELVCAVESVHKMGFIHRDIKPDNILIDRYGHIKLTDFGLCTGFRWTHNSKYYQNGEHSRQDSMEPDQEWINECRCNSNSGPPPLPPPNNNPTKPLLERRKKREHQRCLAHSLVGTPNYIAPEVLMRTGYTQLCDWWSVGVILYEMLVGQPPFLANTPLETQQKVINWEKTLNIPKQANLTRNAIDVTLRLCSSHDRRLGKNGPDEVRQHPFFDGIDFEGGVRRQQAPYKPVIRHATDTSNFDPVDPDKLHNSDSSASDGKGNIIFDNGKHPDHAFFEFTFRRFFDDGGHAYPTRIGDDEDSQGPVYV